MTTRHANRSNLVRVDAAGLTVDTSAYAAGDLVSKGGAVLTFDLGAFGKGAGGLIQSARLVDQAKQQVPLDLVLFDSNPSNTTFTDNAAFDVADADMDKVIGLVRLVDYCALNDNAFALASNLALDFALKGDGSTLYGALVSRGAPTYVAATDLALQLGILF
jgi:hypothetical protein